MSGFAPIPVVDIIDSEVDGYYPSDDGISVGPYPVVGLSLDRIANADVTAEISSDRTVWTVLRGINATAGGSVTTISVAEPTQTIDVQYFAVATYIRIKAEFPLKANRLKAHLMRSPAR